MKASPMSWFTWALCAVVLTSCGFRDKCNYCMFQVDEFVTDSYKIRQGKNAIMEMLGEEVDELPYDAFDEFDDVICEDDVLNIAVYHPSRSDLMKAVEVINKQVGFKVHHGRVDLPDIDSVYIEGLSMEDARNALTNKYQEQVKGIEVFISYRDRLSHQVDLIGEVCANHIPVNGKTHLYDVLALAKIKPSANLFMSYVSRNGCLLPIDLHRLLNEGDMCQNIVMKGGDQIFIARAQDARVMVMGEVGCPKAVDLPYGHLSLRETLVAAGGIPYTGDRSCIQVIRGGIECPKIYVMNWCHITQLPNESLLLMPGDTVYVTEKPITQWNRWISSLLPSMSCFQSGYGCYKVLLP